MELRSKKKLIEGFIQSINVSGSVTEDWKQYVSQKREEDLERLIAGERLKPEATRKFVENALRDGVLRTIGTDIQQVLPPSNPFEKGSHAKKEGIIEKIKAFFDTYLGLTT